MTEQQNTRPSASREIAEKQIKHMVDRFLAWKLPEDFSPDAGISFKATFNEHFDPPGRHEPSGTNLLNATQAEAMVRHMIEGITTPGNTDPIAKYDGELQKMQGGWRDSVDTEFVYPPIPDRSHDWYARFKWHDGDEGLVGYGKTELNAVFDLFQNSLEYENGDGSEQEAVLDAAWLGIGGSLPTEQPSVRAGAVDALAAYQQADQDGIMVMVSRQAIEECLPALRALAQEGE